MRLIQSLALAILVCTGVSLAPLASLVAHAQPVGDDDDDDDDVVDDDVPDPDVAVAPPPGAAEAADDDAVSVNDDGGGAAESVGIAAQEDNDDDAAPGVTAGSDDDGGDDGAAGGTAGSDNDDDDGPMRTASGSDDDDDDDDDDDRPVRTAAGSDDDGDDNDDDIRNNGNDDDGSVEFIGAGEETDRQRETLDREQGIDTDRDGFRYRRHEFVAADLDAKEQAALRSKGFVIVQSERLLGTGGTIHLIRGPARLSDADALGIIDDLTDPTSLSFNHLFDSSSAEVQKLKGKTLSGRQACGCQIGMIDTGIAAKLPQFRHVTVEQRAFNGQVAAPGNHGTAVAHRIAGTKAQRGRSTKIVAADIFSGPRASAGSTFALIKALDWMASRNVAVVNVSLAGPRNPVVAATVERLVKKGHVIVAAAGNDGPAAPPVFPGAYEGVIAVTAVDTTQKVYRYANRGNYVDFSAVGVGVETISPKGDVTAATGTSFAAPVVATRLARELNRPDPTAVARLVSRLEKEARDLGQPGRDRVFGHGLVEDVR